MTLRKREQLQDGVRAREKRVSTSAGGSRKGGGRLARAGRRAEGEGRSHLLHACVVDEPGVGAGAGDDQLGTE